MLQRTAGSAYYWWWPSHMRTKQSKWLDQSLQDMEEKVKTTLKIIDHDGDSFAKRAEMHYKRRPELIVESYKAYRALVKRYDHLSLELQSSNRKIATAFPDEIHFDEDNYEEDIPGSEDKIPRDLSEAKRSGIPQVPKPPCEEISRGFGWKWVTSRRTVNPGRLFQPQGLPRMKQCFHERDHSIVTQFNMASSNLKQHSEKLQDVKFDVEIEDLGLFQEPKKKAVLEEPHEDRGAVKFAKEEIVFVSGPSSEMDALAEKGEPLDLYGLVDGNADRDFHDESMAGLDGVDQPNWRQLFLEGMEDREKIPFKEYATTL